MCTHQIDQYCQILLCDEKLHKCIFTTMRCNKSDTHHTNNEYLQENEALSPWFTWCLNDGLSDVIYVFKISMMHIYTMTRIDRQTP